MKLRSNHIVNKEHINDKISLIFVKSVGMNTQVSQYCTIVSSYYKLNMIMLNKKMVKFDKWIT